MEPVAAARMLAGDHPALPGASESARLRKRIDQQEHSLAVMAAAISALRDGSQALRDENRRLRLELQATQRSNSRPKLRARDSQHEPAPPGSADSELRRRAELARRELRAPRPQTGS